MDKLFLILALILTGFANPSFAQQPIDYSISCHYWAEGDGMVELPGCAAEIDGKFHFSPKLFNKTASQISDGMFTIYLQQQRYYVKPDGAYLSVINFDNGPDYFVEGLVRSRVDGKIGYFDRQFKQVIPPVYDFGWPFENGRALVCIGCKPAPDGEHTAMVGGSWGYIDNNGHRLEPFRSAIYFYGDKQ